MTATTLTALLMAQAATAHEYSAQMKAKKYAEVERSANAKLQSDSNNADALIVKTELILREGTETRLEEAAKLAEQCIAAHPQNSECHEALGNVLGTKAMMGGIMSAIGNAGKIRGSFQKAVELDPKNYSARASLLQFYLQAPGIAGGGKDKAQTLILETMKVSAAAGTLLQANFDLSEDKFAKAETAALTANPAGSDSLADMQRGVLAGLGHTYIKEKKYADSERLFKEISRRYPERAEGAYGMGKSLQEQGKPKEAISYLEQAIAPDASAYAYYRMGKCQQALSDKSKALLAFEKALAFKPELSKKIKAEVEDQLKALKG